MRSELEDSLKSPVEFYKDSERFPIKNNCLYLANCAIGPLYQPSLEKMQNFLTMQSESGIQVADHYGGILSSFREKVAHLLRTEADNVAYVSNTATGINILANGYPFAKGDQVLSYVHEFPSNHYPWLLQKNRGVELILLPDVRDADSGLRAYILHTFG